MSAFLGLGLLVMIVADLWVGSRLIALARRTRKLPEFAIGSSLLLLGGVGYPLAVAARQGVGGPENAALLVGTALMFQNLGCAAMAVGTWKTFRPEDPWGRLACGLVFASLAMSWIAMAVLGHFSEAPGTTPSYWVGFAGRCLPFAWSAAESWHYHLKLRRRLALGLTDRVVTDRFRLWALAVSGGTAGFVVFAIAAVRGIDVSTSPPVLIATSVAGLVAGFYMWLSFCPPRRYLARLRDAETNPIPAPAATR